METPENELDRAYLSGLRALRSAAVGPRAGSPSTQDGSGTTGAATEAALEPRNPNSH